MAPKHGLASFKSEEEQLAKRAKSSATPASRSATPADPGAKVPFEVKYPDMDDSKDRPDEEEELVAHAEWQVSPFEAKGALMDGELDQHFTVVPHHEWETMKKYNNFIIQGEVYKNNQFVFVRGENTPKDKDTEGQPKDFWVARILQVRAKNAQHVYALIAWMYWPEELPPPGTKSKDMESKESGKRTYHGGHELIASNYMEVLDVLSFAGKADVFHWLEEDDNLNHKLYWRQTFNRQTQALSKLREHCVCGGYFNPEKTMFICDNTACKVWLHRECLVEDILSKTYSRLVEGDNGTPDRKTNGIARTNVKKGKGKPRFKGVFEARIKDDGDEAPKAIIKDLRPSADPKTWEEAIQCPKCSTELQ